MLLVPTDIIYVTLNSVEIVLFKGVFGDICYWHIFTPNLMPTNIENMMGDFYS